MTEGECWRCGAGTAYRAEHTDWCLWLTAVDWITPTTDARSTIWWIVDPAWPGRHTVEVPLPNVD